MSDVQPQEKGGSSNEDVPRHTLEWVPELAPSIERELTQENVDELKAIIEEECQVKLAPEEAWERARNLVRLGTVLFDAYIARLRTKAGLPPRERSWDERMAPPEPAPPPVPQPFPIRLEADHAYEVASNLQLLEHELAKTKTHPSSWRWVIVAAYNALGHALAMLHPAEPRDQLHHLLELFDVVAKERPKIRQARSAVMQLEMLRTTWLPRPVSEWPTNLITLRRIVSDCHVMTVVIAGVTNKMRRKQHIDRTPMDAKLPNIRSLDDRPSNLEHGGQ